MASYDKGKSISLDADAAFTAADQFKIVKLSATGCALAAANTDVQVGILQDFPNASGDKVEVMISGTSKCLAGAAVTQGARVTADANGKAVDAGATDQVIGHALSATSAADEIFECLISPGPFDT